MGNYRKKPNNKIQPTQLLPSGEVNNQVSADGISRSKLRISLVQIDISVLVNITSKKSVTVKRIENRYYCFYNAEVLGKIPLNYNNFLPANTSIAGTIIELDKSTPIVIIEI